MKKAQEEYQAAQAAYAAGVHGAPPPPREPAFGNMNTLRRRENRNFKGRNNGNGNGKRAAADAEEGEASDGGSSVSSKLARGVRGMHARDDGDLR